MTCIIFMPVYVYVHLCLYTCSLQSKGIHSEQKYSEFSFDFIGTLPNYLHSNIKGVSGNFPTVFQIICYISQNRINTNWIQTFIVLSIQEVWKRKLSVAFCTSVCVEYLCANKLHTLYVHTCVEREISLFSFL